MNTAHHHADPARGLLLAPQLVRLAVRRLVVVGRRPVRLRAATAPYMDVYEKGILFGRHAGRHLARLVLAAAARADAGRGRVRAAGASRSYQGGLARAETVFWLKYFLSSQSAILWMSVLFFMSTVFYWIGMFAPRPGRRRWSDRLAPGLGRGRHGADRHAGALVRELPDRRRHRPHPGQQPVRSVRAVLLADHRLLPVLRAALRHPRAGRLRDAGGERRGRLSALVHRGARRARDPAAGAGAQELVDEAARAGQLHRLRHLLAVGDGGLRLPDQAAGQRDALVQADAAVGAGRGAVLRADRVPPARRRGGGRQLLGRLLR